MSTSLNPIVSKFSTEAEVAEYEQWFKAKVEASLLKADEPNITRYSSDEVARKMISIIEKYESENANRRMA